MRNRVEPGTCRRQVIQSGDYPPAGAVEFMIRAAFDFGGGNDT
jgi:hypothetical protein